MGFLTIHVIITITSQSKHAEKLFSEDVKKAKKDETTRRELQALRKRLNCGGTSNAIEAFDDLLNASSHKVQKTKVDVRSENAKKFREMFDKGEVPEAEKAEKQPSEKDAELEMMRKSRRQQRDFFKQMEAGKFEQDDKGRKEPKLLVGKLKEVIEFAFSYSCRVHNNTCFSPRAAIQGRIKWRGNARRSARIGLPFSSLFLL